MNALSHQRYRPWMMLTILIALVTGHASLLYLLRRKGMSHAGISGVVVSGMVLLIVAKHLGVFGALLGPLHRLFRRSFRSEKPED